MMSTNELLRREPNFIPAKKNKKKIVGDVIYYTIGTILSLIFILPLLYMVTASTKSPDAYAHALSDKNFILLFIPDFTNLKETFNNYKMILIDHELWKYALNSLLYAAIIIVFNVIVNGLAGYVLAKFDFPAKGFFNFIILFLIVVPIETSIIPLYTIMKQLLHLRQEMTVLGVIFPGVISIFNIFLFTQFFASIPKEYEEAMHIDGSSRVRIFFDLILPLSKPIVATTVAFSFIGVWNDYVWPDMILYKDTSWPLVPVQVALNSIRTIEGIEIGQTMAGLVLTTIPIFVIYTAAQKYIVKGFGTAGLKM
ncbi:MAG: carbohydrate ABC transporter permease [Bacilli bacterium]|nr:carbohydrate ABC transporter permease [Bacilli bacterium]